VDEGGAQKERGPKSVLVAKDRANASQYGPGGVPYTLGKEKKMERIFAERPRKDQGRKKRQEIGRGPLETCYILDREIWGKGRGGRGLETTYLIGKNIWGSRKPKWGPNKVWGAEEKKGATPTTTKQDELSRWKAAPRDKVIEESKHGKRGTVQWPQDGRGKPGWETKVRRVTKKPRGPERPKRGFWGYVAPYEEWRPVPTDIIAKMPKMEKGTE